MRGTWWVVLPTVETAVAIGLPLTYGLAFGACAPPGIGCLLPWVACVAVCGNAWAQFPQVALVGAVIGVAAAGIGAGLALALERWTGPLRSNMWTAWTLAGIGGIAAVAAVTVALTGVNPIFVAIAVGGCSGVLVAINLVPYWLLRTRAGFPAL